MKPDDASLTPGTLIDGARMYAAAADAVNDKLPNAVHVLSHMLGMSIELALKAHLLHSGVSRSELKNLGHRLGTLLDKSIQLGLTETGSRNFRIKVLSPNYEQRLFGYPEEGNMVIIIPRSLRQIADEIIREVFARVKGIQDFESCKADPGLCIQSLYPEDVLPSGWTGKRSADPDPQE
ncbi:MAG: hypothetical protein WBW16_03270 [Bacteroidota bacterium]